MTEQKSTAGQNELYITVRSHSQNKRILEVDSFNQLFKTTQTQVCGLMNPILNLSFDS